MVDHLADFRMEREPPIFFLPPPANADGRDDGDCEAGPQLILLLIQGSAPIEVVNDLEVVQILKHPSERCAAVFDGGSSSTGGSYVRAKHSRVLQLRDYTILTVLDRNQFFALLLNGVLANLDGQIAARRVPRPIWPRPAVSAAAP